MTGQPDCRTGSQPERETLDEDCYRALANKEELAAALRRDRRKADREQEKLRGDAHTENRCPCDCHFLLFRFLLIGYRYERAVKKMSKFRENDRFLQLRRCIILKNALLWRGFFFVRKRICVLLTLCLIFTAAVPATAGQVPFGMLSMLNMTEEECVKRSVGYAGRHHRHRSLFFGRDRGCDAERDGGGNQRLPAMTRLQILDPVFGDPLLKTEMEACSVAI